MGTTLDSAVARISLEFSPSAARARRLDGRMRSELGASLRYLVERLEPFLPAAPGMAAPFLERLELGPVPPIAFALYSDLVLAIDADDLDLAEKLLRQLAALPNHPGDRVIRELKDPETDDESARLTRYIDSDPKMPLALTAPSAASAQQSREAIDGAFRLLAKADPDLGEEIRALLREIVLCRSRQNAPEYVFDGASCFLLWGAILINAERSGGALEMVQMLAHESAHNLLFGLCPSEPLLLNDPAERYSSPLRHDPRPLEGIYHATFVTARMHRSARQLRASGILDAAQEKTVAAQADYTRDSFRQGMALLDAHAKFTEPGRAIIECARAHMADCES
jgi:HEXXH motif-containing protein